MEKSIEELTGHELAQALQDIFLKKDRGKYNKPAGFVY